MSRKQRTVPQLEALWRGLSVEDITVLQAALDAFDGGYDDLIGKLAELGATKTVYEAVNGTAKAIMGKARPDVDTWNADEMQQWGDGYQGTISELEGMQITQGISVMLARIATQRGFIQAKEGTDAGDDW